MKNLVFFRQGMELPCIRSSGGSVLSVNGNSEGLVHLPSRIPRLYPSDIVVQGELESTDAKGVESLLQSLQQDLARKLSSAQELFEKSFKKPPEALLLLVGDPSRISLEKKEGEYTLNVEIFLSFGFLEDASYYQHLESNWGKFDGALISKAIPKVSSTKSIESYTPLISWLTSEVKNQLFRPVILSENRKTSF